MRKTWGGYLIVAVQDGNYIHKTKPDAEILYTTEQRIDLIKALRVVDEVIVYQDVDRILPEVEFDVFAVGEDQNHAGFLHAVRWCRDHGKEVVRLSRTPGICSSSIKSQHERLK